MGHWGLLETPSGAIVRRSARLAALAFTSLASPALAQTITGDSAVVIVTPLSLVNTDSLQYGEIVAGTTAGTVTIAINTGNRTSTGGVTPVGTNYHRAEFLGMAAIGFLTTVSVQANTTLNRVGGGASMTTTLVREGPALRWFPGTGIQTFRVGGTLSVGANQMPGQYSGTFTMTVNYF